MNKINSLVNAKELHIQSILSGPQYFVCKRHACTMPKRVCALRQITDGGLMNFMDCKECEQGEEIGREFPNLTVEKKRPLFLESRQKYKRASHAV